MKKKIFEIVFSRFYLLICLFNFNLYSSHSQTTHPKQQPTCKCVLSGGAGIGKSTVIDLLQKNGYQTTPEVWTMYYEEAQRNNTLDEFNNPALSIAWREKQMNKQLSMEAALNKNKLAFLDRSTIDVVAFGKLFNTPMAQSITDIPLNHQYDLIFFLNPLPAHLYKKSHLCSYEDSIKLHTYLKKYYQELGYTIIEVPFDTPEKRIEFILKSIRSHCCSLKS